ncbi:hypothetical protein CYMTET_53463 [Cymbomonas tetramitiformis]|uniref:N-acetyltransferase domain-containing protein n=1 Tax=Cymbomonas tetramitiformis TaxID=36881 RepID=A0AAE0BGU5_9CHLO|nr:hypothetical protein CYMTET_53463 [Cymbomonas tetramitiformis]
MKRKAPPETLEEGPPQTAVSNEADIKSSPNETDSEKRNVSNTLTKDENASSFIRSFTYGVRSLPQAEASGCGYEDVCSRYAQYKQGIVGGTVRGKHGEYLDFNVILINGGVPYDGEDKAYYVFLDEVMEIVETFVPEARRKRGLASKLSFEAMNLAVEHGWQVRPTCTYTKDTFLKREGADCWHLIEFACTEKGAEIKQRRVQLKNMALSELRKLCQRFGKSSGAKPALIERIVKYELTSWTAQDEKRRRFKAIGGSVGTSS